MFHLIVATVLPTLSGGAKAMCPLSYSSDGTPPFSDEAMDKIYTFWRANLNIDNKGAVVAAPDFNAAADCPGFPVGKTNNYYFHWVRDAALTMHVVFTVGVPEMHELLLKYAGWEKKVTGQPHVHEGVDILGEPKFFMNGSADYPDYSSCMRPQNDGPALRAKVLSEYAMSGQHEYDQVISLTTIQEYLYLIVQRDLNYVVRVWDHPTCEPWEEKPSSDAFFDLYAMRAGLVVGARFAESLVKLGSVIHRYKEDAQKYMKVANAIKSKLSGHFNVTGEYIYEDTFDWKSHMDGAVIEAFNDGYLDDGLFGPLSPEVLKTVIAYNELFCNEYEINQKDTLAGIPGILYGRYASDDFCGGNPWVLLSAALATLIYRTAAALLQTEHVSSTTYGLLQKAYGISDGLAGKDLADAVMGAADGVMLRIRHHVAGDGYVMHEQLHRDDGHQLSARHLTWSYSNVIKAMHERKTYTMAAEQHTRMVAARLHLRLPVTFATIVCAALAFSACLAMMQAVHRRRSTRLDDRPLLAEEPKLLA